MEPTPDLNVNDVTILSDKELLNVVKGRREDHTARSLVLVNAEIAERGGMSDLLLRVKSATAARPWLAGCIVCLRCGESIMLTPCERRAKRVLCPKCDTAQDLNDVPGMVTSLIELYAPFNYGSCFLGPIWAISHGFTTLGLAIILLTVAAFAIGWEGVFVLLSLAIALGFFGNRMVWHRRRYTSIRELETKQRAWNRAGLIVAAFTAVLLFSLMLKSP